MKKMLLVLPALVIPFLTMAFWALGGGKGKSEVQPQSGLNLMLPDANLKEEIGLDKLSFYDQAEKDSMRRAEWMRDDPFFRLDTSASYEQEMPYDFSTPSFKPGLNTSPYERPVADPEAQLLKKLEQLQAELDRPATASPPEISAPVSPDLDRLESMMKSVSSGGEDPEMNQLQNTLDRILDIQHPERVKQRSIRNQGAAYAVRLRSGADTLVTGFYSYSDAAELYPPEQTAIEAIVAVNQTIVNGAVVKFRLVNDIFIRGTLVPGNTLFSGIASLEGERLQITISSIRSGKSIFNVRLDIYDMDGLPGIYIPGTINREAAKEALNNSLSLADLSSADPGLKARAAATGAGALKSLVSRKAKLVRVQLKAGYKVLLNNKNPEQ